MCPIEKPDLVDLLIGQTWIGLPYIYWVVYSRQFHTDWIYKSNSWQTINLNPISEKEVWQFLEKHVGNHVYMWTYAYVNCQRVKCKYRKYLNTP